MLLRICASSSKVRRKSEIEQAGYYCYDEGCCVEGESLHGNRIPRVRALMNPDKVSQSTRSRVEQAALEVGYFPQSMGRNVKRNESRTTLVIVPDICDPFLSEIIRGIEG